MFICKWPDPYIVGYQAVGTSDSVKVDLPIVSSLTFKSRDKILKYEIEI